MPDSEPVTTQRERIRLVVLFGGRSAEHDISRVSASHVMSAVDPERYEVVPVGITRSGEWRLAERAAELLGTGAELPSAIDVEGRTVDPLGPGGLVADVAPASGPGDGSPVTVVFPVLHGPNGEDGTVQGLLKLAGIPCVGSGVLGSAVCMDKVMAKAVLAAHGIPQVAYCLVTRSEFAATPEAAIERASALGFPLFVKPANLGSSVGISKAKHDTELRTALRLAFELDRRVIVEAATREKPREIEVGILGNDQPHASPVGELTFNAEFYDYETKYTPGRAEMHIPANVPAAIAERARSLAIDAFRALDCAGLARVDFFYLDGSGELFLNEVNTMPGFTRTSMYTELWRAAGIGYGELVSRLVELALERR